MSQNLLDRIDLALLDRLQRDGRITNQALAEAVNLSPSACLARVRGLEKRKIIVGYHARIIPEHVAPLIILFAEVTLRSHHPKDFASFEQTMLPISEVLEVSEISGAFDYLIKVAVTDIGAWRALSDRLLTADLGVDKIVSHVLMKEAKPFGGYPIKTFKR